MAEAAANLALHGVPLVTEHYDKVYDPVKNKTRQAVSKVKEMRNGHGGVTEEEDYTEYDYDGPPRRSQTDRPRRSGHDRHRERGRDDLVEERRVVRTTNGRTKSVGAEARRDMRRDRRRDTRRDFSDSESSRSPPRRRDKRRQSLGERALAALGLGAAGGALAGRASSRSRRRSVSSESSYTRGGRRQRSRSADYNRRQSNRSVGAPLSRGYDDDRTPARYRPSGYANGGSRSRAGSRSGQNQLVKRDNRQDVARSDRRKGSSSASSSDDDEDVCSSSEDERRTRKMRGKEFLTAGLAAVATIHAAHSVYSSMEARDKRHLEVMKGEMSPKEAQKKKNQARLQDAASIGIAALGIKGAYSEWKEVQESRHEMGELQKERAERHEKRLKKAEKMMNGGGGSSRDSGRDRNRSEPGSRRRRDSR